MMATSCVAILAEVGNNQRGSISTDVLACAIELGDHVGLPIRVVLLGADPTDEAQRIAHRTAFDVIGLERPEFQLLDSETNSAILADTMLELGAEFVCMAQSSFGMACAPVLAGLLDAACIVGVEGLHFEEGQFTFARGIHGGQEIARVASTSKITILTVPPGAFPLELPFAPASGRVELRTVSQSGSRTKFFELTEPEGEDAGLQEADVIVAAGRGIGDKKNLDLIQDLADLFHRSALGASRPLSDLGWVEYNRQVGFTGATVAPKLYLACGISGATQHVMGMSGSGLVVAVNKDPEAAIFNTADLAVVEDLTIFIPAFLQAVERIRPSRPGVES